MGPQDGPLLAQVLGRLATELYHSDRSEEVAALGEQTVAMARRTGDCATPASRLNARFLTLWALEHAEERLQVASDMVALGEEVRDPDLVLRGHSWRIVSLMELGDWGATDIELAVHARLAEDLRDPLHLWHALLYRTTRALLVHVAESSAWSSGMPGRDPAVDGARLRAGCTGAGAGGRQARIGRPENAWNLRTRVLEGRLSEAEHLAGEALAVGRGVQAQNAGQLYAVQLFALRTEQGRLAEIEPSLEEFGRRYLLSLGSFRT